MGTFLVPNYPYFWTQCDTDLPNLLPLSSWELLTWDMFIYLEVFDRSRVLNLQVPIFVG
jgi:hypothetical protein